MISCSLFVLSVTLLQASELQLVFAVDSIGTIVLSFDGFNDEYLEDIVSLRKDGTIGKHAARVQLMQSVNVTKTLSTHHTVSTGVLPNLHGVIADSMFDATGKVMSNTKEQYEYKITKDQNNKTLFPIVPLWVRFEANEVTCGCMMWPGCDVQHLMKPIMLWSERIEKIAEWAITGTYKIIFGHFEDKFNADGIDTSPREDIVKRVADAIELLQKILDDADESDSFDIVIMSAQGKKSVERENVFNIDTYADPKEYDVIASGAIVFIRAKTGGNIDALYQDLKNCDKNDDRQLDDGTLYNVYRHDEEALEQYNLNGFPLLKDVLTLTVLGNNAFYNEEKYNKVQAHNTTRENGYEKQDADMDGILVLKGPTFNNKHSTQPAKIEDVYHLLAHLASVGSASNSLALEKSILKELLEEPILQKWEIRH